VSIESNKVIARRIVEEILEAGRTDTISELFTPDFYSHAWGPLYGDGIEGVRGIVEFTKKAFANVKCEIIDIIAEEDRAATFYTYYAEQVGDMFGQPSTGKSFKEPIVHILRFENGKVAEHWRVENELSMLKQLGIWPEAVDYRPPHLEAIGDG
jgi:predicted ester cyclase